MFLARPEATEELVNVHENTWVSSTRVSRRVVNCGVLPMFGLCLQSFYLLIEQDCRMSFHSAGSWGPHIRPSDVHHAAQQVSVGHQDIS